MRIAIVGSGAVGGYVGARLSAGGEDVTFFARGAHLAVLQARGLRVESPRGNVELPRVRATDRSEGTGPVDVVLFAVKMYDLEPASTLLPPLLGAETVVIPIQNGIESVELLARSLPPGHLAGGTVHLAAVVREPGVIAHTALERLFFGELDGVKTPRLERLLAACHAARLQATLSDHIDVDIWSKFVSLTVFSGMTAVTRSSIGPIREDSDLFSMFQAACLEAMAVARARGVALPGTLFEDVIRRMQSLPPQSKSSMLEDLERGRPLELPWLSGAVVRLGRQLGIDTPIHRFIATVLRPHVGGSRARDASAAVAGAG